MAAGVYHGPAWVARRENPRTQSPGVSESAVSWHPVVLQELAKIDEERQGR